MSGLGQAARSALLWGAGATLIRDIGQFALMLVLVRLLGPEDYGLAGLAQSAIGVIAVFSFGSFVQHALQSRDPDDVDWSRHLIFGAALNGVLFALCLVGAGFLYTIDSYSDLAIPFAAASFVLLLEVPSGLRFNMLQAKHEWGRFRGLILSGFVLASVSALAVALAGGGYWSLLIQPAVMLVPASVDLVSCRRELSSGSWKWEWGTYKDVLAFGANRISALALTRGQQFSENSILTEYHGLGEVGVFGRARGLCTLLTGRVATLTIQSLYPVLTRAERRSEQFIRIAGLTLRGISWAAIPAAAFLASCPKDIILCLYGPKWLQAVEILPAAAIGAGLLGILQVLERLFLAAEQLKLSLLTGGAAALASLCAAFIFLPDGAESYLVALCYVLSATLAWAGWLAVRNGVLSMRALVFAILAPLFAVFWSVSAVVLVDPLLSVQNSLARVLSLGLVFSTFYGAILRAIFPTALRELLAVVPGGRLLRRVALM